MGLSQQYGTYEDWVSDFWLSKKISHFSFSFLQKALSLTRLRLRSPTLKLELLFWLQWADRDGWHHGWWPLNPLWQEVPDTGQTQVELGHGERRVPPQLVCVPFPRLLITLKIAWRCIAGKMRPAICPWCRYTLHLFPSFHNSRWLWW